jgi:hypothetical protein
MIIPPSILNHKLFFNTTNGKSKPASIEISVRVGTVTAEVQVPRTAAA